MVKQAGNALLKLHRALPLLFWIPAIIVALLCWVGLSDTTGFIASVSALNQQIFGLFGNFYLWFAWLCLIVFVLLGLSPIGKIRLGGAEAKPEYSFFSWFAMLFCAGMGTGFMFWGAAEPLYHFMNTPLKGSYTPTEANIIALRYTFFHWGLQPWAIYGMTALAIGFFGFNLNRGYGFSSFLVTLLPGVHYQRYEKNLTFIIDLMTILAIIFGVAATIGMGVLQIQGGLRNFLGWHPTPFLEGLILVLVTGAYITSSLLGVDKGIKVLSNVNLGLSILMLLWVIFVGPTQDIGQGLFQALPAYIQTLPQMSLGLGHFHPANWVGDWTVKYWTWWIAWAPFVGLFIAFISKGRTIRELMFGVTLAPTLFSCIWFTIFGESAIHLQQTEHLFGAALNLQQVDRILFSLLERLAHHPFMAMLSLLLVAINFINSADSATYTIASLSAQNLEGEPPALLQLVWGILFAVLAGLLLLTGGIDILQQVTMVAVLPFTLLLGLVFISLLGSLIHYRKQMLLGEAPIPPTIAEATCNEA